MPSTTVSRGRSGWRFDKVNDRLEFYFNGTKVGHLNASGFTITTVAIESGTITGITDLAVADGGTGASTLTQYAVLTGNATGAITPLSTGTATYVLTSAGSGGVPTWEASASAGANTGLSNLGSVAINTSLVSDTDNTDDLGTTSKAWKTGYLTTVELGNATDTTIARASAGNLSVEGNLVYRAGGTDVPVADGGTGASTASITSFNNITGFTASGATGTTSTSLVFSTSPSFTTPLLGTPTSGNLGTCTVDGTNLVGYRSIPNTGAKTASYTLVAGDVGKFIELGSSGTVVVPASTFAAGDAFSIFNNTSATISCTCSAVTTVYKGGTDTDISTFSVTTRGVATFLFITATVAVVTGNLA